MPETNSLLPQDKTTDETRPADTATTNVLPIGRALFERIGVGGMGEVYRCGDDALERDLAIKILKPELRGDTAAEQRFLREARLTGSLQHPGIVPVHNLGRLADGRPCYTMKLVRGRTLADLLRDEPEGPERLPRLLAIIEKVCQSVAYAHSMHVIHRDLKPNNVMVGEFGEVQVMDWGLAKELSRSEPPPPAEETVSVETAAWKEEGEGLSRAGSALGTPSYMPPEQAAGDWDIVDERADVFALGAILCEILTGQPPYHGGNRDDLLRRARRGDLAEALGRLEKCPADAVLVNLCRECLSADRLQRPRHAGVVAERLAAYEAEVQELLRRAEVERARSEVQAREERKRRRLTLVLAALSLLLLTGIGGALWWKYLKQDQANREALAVLDWARERLQEGWRRHDLKELEDAKVNCERAADIARSGGASDAVVQQVVDLRSEIQERLDRAKQNEKLLSELLDIAIPHETKTYKADESGRIMMAMAEPSVEEQYSAAFRRRWPDVDFDVRTQSEVAATLQEEPEAVVQGVIAGLDGWMLEQRRRNRDETKWRYLLGLVERLDHSEPRSQLRALLIDGVPPRPVDVAGLMGGWPPWIALWKLHRGNEWLHLRQLRDRMDPASEPVLTVLLLAEASREVGDMAGAERVLRLALARRPDEVALLDALGKLLDWPGSQRIAEAIGFYRAARAKNPALGIALGQALAHAGQAMEGEAILRDLLRERPNNPEILCCLSEALASLRKLAEMEVVCRRAIELKPDYGSAYFYLGHALYYSGKHAEAEDAFRKATELGKSPIMFFVLRGVHFQHGKLAEAEAALREAIELEPDNGNNYLILGDLDIQQGKAAEAEAAFRKAIALKTDDPQAYFYVGNALHGRGQYAEAEPLYRKVIALEPDDAQAHCNLGVILSGQEKYAEAEAAWRRVIELIPDFAYSYFNLGNALSGQEKYAEAEAAFRKATALKPDDALAYNNLGALLHDHLRKHVEAELAFRKAISLEPHYAEAHCNLGTALRSQGRLKESLSAYQRGHELGSRRADWQYSSIQRVREAERLVTLEKKLPAILQGTESPFNADDAITLALLCRQSYQKRYAAAARLYAYAFAAEPQLAADNRYNAACSSALAAAGLAEDSRSLPDEGRSRLRRQALAWLRDDLTAYTKLAEQNTPAVKQTNQQRLAHWRSDPDLASVRDPRALDRLPENERAAWQALWRDVDALAKRTANNEKAGSGGKKPDTQINGAKKGKP